MLTITTIGVVEGVGLGLDTTVAVALAVPVGVPVAEGVAVDDRVGVWEDGAAVRVGVGVSNAAVTVLAGVVVALGRGAGGVSSSHPQPAWTKLQATINSPTPRLDQPRRALRCSSRISVPPPNATS